ncbi:TonB-linked outer membrane protein, SusC/RagA family [bacterium A37T11]|nr:TonB-linked outer membrane protein, SusC/RagA family [bacterium A37T11]
MLWGIKLPKSIHQLLLVMRIASILLLAACMHLSAASLSQTITLHLKKEPLSKVFALLEKQTGYFVVYNDDLLSTTEPVTINADRIPLEGFLKKILASQPLCYSLDGTTILITKKNAAPFPFQQRTITGKVTDDKGNALDGVNIQLKGVAGGTISNSQGLYTIKVVQENSILIFSYVGFGSVERNVRESNVINVVLSPQEDNLNEVVVVGYGTMNRRDLTGAVSSVKGVTFKDMPVTSIGDAIVGRMAGVQVSRTEGDPDAPIKIRVRGGGSITQDNSPLFIVDGFPVDDISDISPTDIVKVDVLKDASSTAIYGARGANGVIVITTKSGLEGGGKIRINSYAGIKKITKYLEVLDPYEYVYWQYELQNSTATIDRYFGDFRDFGLYKQVKGINWQDEIFGQTGSSFSNNLSFSGGSKTTTYNISVTRNDEKEIMIGSGYSRTNLTANTTHKVNDWLSLNLNTRLSDYRLKGAGTTSGTRLSHAVQFRPVNGLMDFVDTDIDDGDYETTAAGILNPLKQTLDDYRRLHRLTFNFNGSASVKISDHINYRFEYGVQYGEDANNRFYGINTSNAVNYGKQPIATIQGITANSQRVANVLTYTKTNMFPDHDLTLMVGQELNYNKSNSITSTSRYFPKYIDAVSAINMMSLGIPDPTETFDDPAVKIASFFGRLNYSYKGRYLLSATYRADGSTKFVPANRWGYFPSAALAWRINDENFMAGSRRWLDDLKLRISYGASGNNRIPDNAWQKTYTVGTGGVYLDGDGDGSTRTAFLQPNNVLSNPILKWETTITKNIGLDFSLFHNRLSGILEVYKNNTKDLLISATIPSSTGYANQWQNIGQTSNRGLEVTLNGNLMHTKDFQLDISFNIGLNKNRIDKLGDTKRWEQSSDWFTTNSGPSGEYLIKEGGQVGLMYGYQTDGMYTFDDFDYVNGQYTLKEGVADDRALLSAKRFWPGALKLKDQNGDYKVDAVNDKVVIGNANPKHSGGFNIAAKYKSFDLTAFFNWTYGNDIYNANKLYFSQSATGGIYKNILNIMNSEHRFTYIDKTSGAIVSDPALLAEMNKNATIWSAAYNYGVFHSWDVEDGSFLRLNTLTFGYTVPEAILKKWHIQSLRIYGSAYNIWTWTNYTGYDPEVDTRRATPLTPGIDWNAYPRSRTFNVGLNVEF